MFININDLKRTAIIFICVVASTACGGTPPDPTPQYCAQFGGRFESRLSASTIMNYCVFSDNSECETWSFYRGQCHSGQHQSTDSSATKGRMLQLIADLSSANILIKPVSAFWGNNAVMLSSIGFAYTIPAGSSFNLSTVYEHRSAELIWIRATKDVVEMDDAQRLIQSEIKALPNRGRDIGAVRYYRCDDLIVAYVVAPKHNVDPGIDTAMTEICGPIIAKYP